MISNLSTPLLGAVDTAVVGHLPDPAYIGGVAVGAIIFDFLYWGFGFLRMGTTGFTAPGLRRRRRRRAARHPGPLPDPGGRPGRAFDRAPGIRSAGSPYGCSKPAIRWRGFAREYYLIRIWSAPAALANYAILGWLLGMGRARAVLMLQLALNGTNIVLDLVFVIGSWLGCRGRGARQFGGGIRGGRDPGFAAILIRILKVGGWPLGLAPDRGRPPNHRPCSA